MRIGNTWLAAAAVSSLCAVVAAQRPVSPRSSRVGLGSDGSGSVVAQRKINETNGGFTGLLEDRDKFGGGVFAIGDLDRDGVGDLAVGAPGGDRGGLNSGAIWILFMNADGTVRAETKINDGLNGLDGQLGYTAALGSSITTLGDMDGDGVVDLAVGVPEKDGPPLAPPCFNTIRRCDRGGYVVLFMNEDGTVRDSIVIAADVNFDTFLVKGDELARGLAGIGDIDGDGTPDLVASTPGFDFPDIDAGAFFVVLNNPDGTTKAEICISDDFNGFAGPLFAGDRFGSSCASLGDLDGDGVVDVAIGAEGDSDTGVERGAVWILFLNADGTVRDQQKINMLAGGFAGSLTNGDRFGSSCAAIGDVNGDGVVDLAVGAELDRDGGLGSGAVWILFLNTDGTVNGEQKISALPGVEADARLGTSVAAVGDIDGDGVNDLAAGAPLDDENGESRGALWLLSLDGVASIDFEGAVNGSQVGGGTVGSTGVLIEGFPQSGLTAAVFDSTPTGPNAASSDPDLLVDTGNVLILQEVAGQSAEGVYDEPDDDAQGGDFLLTFGGLEVLPLSIDLVDLCPAPGQTARVTLTDSSGGRRIYSVPPGWTEDVAMEGGTGYRTLDLTTLSDQPGYVATATASQETGFDPRSTVMMEIHLTSSGAIDNVVYDPHPDAPERLYPRQPSYRLRRR